MKKLIIVFAIIALALTACGSSSVPKGADAKAWNAGNRSLQYLDKWEEERDDPSGDGIATKIMKEIDATGVTANILMKSDRTAKEQYIRDMYYALLYLGGYEKPNSYMGAVFSISADGQQGTDEDYKHYYECKQKLVDLLQIEYTEDYTLLNKR